MDKYIENIRNKINNHSAELMRLKNELDNIVSNCEHEFPEKPRYNDSHYEYYQCEVCGAIFSDRDIALKDLSI